MSYEFHPRTLELLRRVLDDAWAEMPGINEKHDLKARMAQRILQCAAKGERDPERLKAAIRAVRLDAAAERSAAHSPGQ